MAKSDSHQNSMFYPKMGVVCAVQKLTEKTTSLYTPDPIGTMKIGLIIAPVNEETHYPKIEGTPFRMIVDQHTKGSMQRSNLLRCTRGVGVCVRTLKRPQVR